MTSSIELLIEPRPTDLGDFEVRRVLPFAKKRMVGPFIFFDHMGPAEFPPGKGIDVRPHPHIGLATVTYLFDGEIMHRDSLGCEQAIRPGAVNWMTAGHGIVHSERTGDEERAKASTIHGIQAWVALPKTHEKTEPDFKHHPTESLPEFDEGGVCMKLLAGEAFGKKADVDVLWPTVYLDIQAGDGCRISIPDEHEERALYVVSGSLEIDGEAVNEHTMAVLTPGSKPEVISTAESRVMLCGGAKMDGHRTIWWNFVASDKDLLEQAKADWKAGRFPKVPGEDEFIPLPD
ncbi:MAG: pirin family protein [Rhodospirillales bacterium]|nr:pirin family protein [Rhodospirillales bacterium]